MTDITDAGATGATAGAPADQSTTDTSTDETSQFDQANALADEASPPELDPGFGDEASDEPSTETVALKVNGKELQMPLAEVIAAAQRELAAGGKLEQVKKASAEIKEQQAVIAKQQGAVKQLLEVFSKGDFDTMSDFAESIKAGDAFKRGAIQYAMKLYEYSKMSPEQREHIESKKELERMRKAQADRERQDSDRAFQYQVNQWTQHIATELPKAFKEAGLPDTAFVREHAIATWKAAVERGQQPTALAVAQHVRQRMDEAKLLNASQQAPARPPRPRATPQSVGMKGTGKEDSQYIEMSAWQKNRGRV